MVRTITHESHHTPVRDYDDEDREYVADNSDRHVALRADEIDEVHEARRDEAVERYGGINVGAAFFGWITAVGVTLLVTSIFAALGITTAFNELSNGTAAVNAETVRGIGLAGGIAALIAIAIGYYAGGYVAGRMSRFNGAAQGAGVFGFGLAVMILVGLLAWGLGDQFNLLQYINLPAFVSVGSLTAASLLGLTLTIAVMLFSAIAGGKVGEHYHEKVDRAAFTH